MGPELEPNPTWAAPAQIGITRLAQAMKTPALVAIAYLVGGKTAFLIGTLSDKIFAPFWPPNIILLCALLFTPIRRWWIIIAAAFPAHVVVELAPRMQFSQMLLAFATNCLVAILNAICIRRLIDGPPWFDRLSKTVRYIFITALFCPAIVSLGGAFVPILEGRELDNYWRYWMQWYLSNAIGCLTLGPIALIMIDEYKKVSGSLSLHTILEIIFVALALAATCTLAFAVDARWEGNGFFPVFLYSPLPIILWAAVRFGTKGASSAILVVTVALIWLAINGPSVFEMRNPDMSVFAIQTFLVCLSIPTLLLGASSDEAIKAEQIARESEERMAFAAAAANVSLWRLDYRSDQFWLTEYGRRIFGFEPEKSLTLNMILSSIHPEDREFTRDFILSTVPRQSAAADFEFRIVRPSGEVRWFRARSRAQPDGKGGQSRASGTFVDITEQKAVETEAIHQREEIAHLMRVSMLGELSAGIAHELSQPLTAILSNAQAARLLMDDEFGDKTEVTAALDDIIIDDTRAGEVVQRFRGLLRKGETRFCELNVNDLIKSTLRLLHSELISRRVRVESEFAKMLPAIRADTVQLQQVIINLVMNSIDAMTGTQMPLRTITISTALIGSDEVLVSISDHGHGLNPVHEERLFQPFFTTKENGLGLGLSICESIIASHGGRLKLESGSGGGAVATFILPIPRAEGGVAEAG